MNKKYKLTDETKKIHSITLHRIKALKDFGNVKKGDLGGWIESEDNLSHDGDAWVSDEAKVFDNAKVYENAWVFGDASIYGNAEVYGHAKVFGDTKVFGHAKVCGRPPSGGNEQTGSGFFHGTDL